MKAEARDRSLRALWSSARWTSRTILNYNLTGKHMKKAILAALAIVTVLGMHQAAEAQELIATFDTAIGNGPTPGATASLTLNSDGTIAATATSLSTLQLVGFGVDSFFQYPSYDFSATDVTSSGWGTSFGGFATGWTSSFGVESMTWLIGSPGTFASIFDVLNGSGSDFDAFIFARDPVSGEFTEYAANFTSVAAIPEPETYALFLAGMVALALARKRSAKRRA
jgi:hypothetical protein